MVSAPGLAAVSAFGEAVSEADQAQKLAAISIQVLAARVTGQLYDIGEGIRSEIVATLQQLTECSNRGRKSQFTTGLRYRFDFIATDGTFY
jgi:hypothetical protein